METITVTNKAFGEKLLNVIKAKKDFIASEQAKIQAQKQKNQ
jgi:hypothetical protein